MAFLRCTILTREIVNDTSQCLQVVKDSHLLMLVAVVAAVDLLILILWSTLDPIKLSVVKLSNQVSARGQIHHELAEIES